jgi:hypothetical protein
VPETKQTKPMVAPMSNKKRLDIDESVIQPVMATNEDSLADCLIDDVDRASSKGRKASNADTTDPDTNAFLCLNYTECYPSVPPKIFDTYGIVKYSPKMEFGDRVGLLTTGQALLAFLRLGYKVYVK